MHLAAFAARASFSGRSHVITRRAGVSTALFSSKNWSTQTVKSLQAELRSRGLAVSGRKQELIARLSKADEAASPKATSSAGPTAAPSPAPARRNFSASATQKQAAAAQKSDAPDPTPRDSKIAFDAPKEPSIDDHGSGANTKFPQIQDEPEVDASPPIVTPSAKTKHSESGSTQDPRQDTHTPSEIATTVAPDHLPGGGPSSVHHELSTDAPSSHATGQGEENRGVGNFKRDAEHLTEKAKDEASRMFEEFKKEVQGSEQGLYEKLENISGVKIPPFSEAFKADGAKFEPEQRDLNGDEVRGLYVLIGIVGIGFILGSFGKPSAKDRHARRSHN